MESIKTFITNDLKFGGSNESNLKKTAEWKRINTEKNEKQQKGVGYAYC